MKSEANLVYAWSANQSRTVMETISLIGTPTKESFLLDVDLNVLVLVDIG